MKRLLSKEQFVEIMNAVMKEEDFRIIVEKNCRDLNRCIPDKFQEDIGIYFPTQNPILTEVLEIMFDDTEYGFISWWCYEKDYGRDIKEGDLTEPDGTNIDLTTPEALYDFLVANIGDSDTENEE